MKIQKIKFSSENKLSEIQTEENKNLVGLKNFGPVIFHINLLYHLLKHFKNEIINLEKNNNLYKIIRGKRL
jgi:hypothetical protein